MAEIISMSLRKEDLQELNSLQKDLGLKGRSETIRAAVKSLKSESQVLGKLNGNVDGIVMIVYSERNNSLSKTIHDYDAVIKTQIHNHMQNHECLEVLIVRSKAGVVKEFVKELQKNKKVKMVKFVLG